MTFAADLHTLYRLVVAPIRGATHAQRLESFYSTQAQGYDTFRRRLLHGRRELVTALDFRPGAVWVDMGAGTGSNLDYISGRVPSLEEIYLVDLSQSLLSVAKERIAANNWLHVTPVEADAYSFRPRQLADIVTFSYSLTMIPEWTRALNHARSLLKPGGRIGVVDFYVSRKYPAAGRTRHRWWQRHFWPLWFERDNVYPSRDHLPFLEENFQCLQIVESTAWVPYLPFMRVPYYRFIGKRE